MRAALISTKINIFHVIKTLGRFSSTKNELSRAKGQINESVKIDRPTVELLQQLSLVNIGNETAIHRLEAAISFADQLMEVDTTDVEPMYSVQDRALFLRDDVRTVGNCRDELLKLASKTQDEYFISPSGNIPITFKDKELISDK